MCENYCDDDAEVYALEEEPLVAVHASFYDQCGAGFVADTSDQASRGEGCPLQDHHKMVVNDGMQLLGYDFKDFVQYHVMP